MILTRISIKFPATSAITHVGQQYSNRMAEAVEEERWRGLKVEEGRGVWGPNKNICTEANHKCVPLPFPALVKRVINIERLYLLGQQISTSV